jgi:hypothetical protein
VATQILCLVEIGLGLWLSLRETESVTGDLAPETPVGEEPIS